MTTFQSIVYAIVHGLSEFLPVGTSAHDLLIAYLIHWQAPIPALIHAFTLGSFLALLLYFRHDWASMISCFLQVILFRKRPMTLDERLPLFLFVSTLPSIAVASYLKTTIMEIEWTPLLTGGVLALVSIPLWFFDYLSRKTKGMFDWKWLDAAVVGITQIIGLVPGGSFLTGALIGAFFLNYKRESAVKYSYFAIMPLLITKTLSLAHEVGFGTSSPAPDLSWLSYCVALVISCLVGLLAIGGFTRHMQQKSVSQYVIYHFLLVSVVGCTYWIRIHNGG